MNKNKDNITTSISSITKLSCLIALLSLTQASWAETVRFTVSPMHLTAPTTLVLALFKENSALFDKRFKNPGKADLYCRQEVPTAHDKETLACDLPAGRYIGIAYLDTDHDGELTHGTFGPREPFGLTGVPQGFTLPPPAEQTIIDTRRNLEFRITLNQP